MVSSRTSPKLGHVSPPAFVHFFFFFSSGRLPEPPYKGQYLHRTLYGGRGVGMGGFGLWLFLLTSVTVTHFPNACLLREHFCSVRRFCFPQKHLVLHDLCAFTPGTCRAPQPLLSACEGDYALLVKTGGMLKKKKNPHSFLD